MNYRALIFDFDGLMLDTERAAFQAWTEIYSRFNAQLDLTDWVQCVGASYSLFDVVTHLGSQVGPDVLIDRDALVAEKNERKAAICKHLPPMPGVLDLLDEAESQGIKLAVASSSFMDWVGPHLDRLQITNRFSAVTTGDQVTKVKPDPELYLTTAKRLGIKPEHCLVLEDSVNGVKAARSAGMDVYAVPNVITQGLDFSLATKVFKSLEDIRLI